MTAHAARERLWELADGVTVTHRPAPGVGEYFALRGSRVVGEVVRHGGRMVHVALFPSAACA